MSGWYGRCVVGFQEIYLTVAWTLLSLKRSHRYTEIVGETRTATVGGYVFRRVHANSVNLRVYNFKDLSFSIFWIEWHRELQVRNNGTKEYFRSHASPFYTIGTPSTPTNWPVSTPNSQLSKNWENCKLNFLSVRCWGSYSLNKWKWCPLYNRIQTSEHLRYWWAWRSCADFNHLGGISIATANNVEVK